MLVTILTVFLYYKLSFGYWKNRGISFLEPSLIFGNLAPVVFRKICYAELMVQKQREIKNRGLKFGGIFAFNKPILILTDPYLIKKMFIKDAAFFPDRGIYYDEKNDPLSAHLVVLTGPKWKKIRAACSPVFTPAQMRIGLPMFVECAQQLVEVVESYQKNGQPLDARDFMARYTTDVIGKSI